MKDSAIKKIIIENYKCTLPILGKTSVTNGIATRKETMRNTKTAKTLDCQQHLTITLNGVNIYMITEFNHFHGDIIRVFQIGEEPHGTGVDWSFFHGWEMECDTANGRCGVRPFERDSLAYECLWKQLGLDFPPEEPGDYRPSYSDFHLFRRAVLIAGGTCVYTHH